MNSRGGRGRRAGSAGRADITRRPCGGRKAAEASSAVTTAPVSRHRRPRLTKNIVLNNRGEAIIVSHDEPARVDDLSPAIQDVIAITRRPPDEPAHWSESESFQCRAFSFRSSRTGLRASTRCTISTMRARPRWALSELGDTYRRAKLPPRQDGDFAQRRRRADRVSRRRRTYIGYRWPRRAQSRMNR